MSRPIPSPRPPPPPIDVNGHLKNRATYRGDDVIDVIEQQGIEKIEDVFGTSADTSFCNYHVCLPRV